MATDTLLILQARMTSTRLPGKVLLPVLGKPLLAYQLERLRRATTIDHIVVATTVKATDDAIVRVCADLGVATFRGSEDDVLERYYHAATAYHPRFVVRCTADCPLIDWGLVDDVVSTLQRSAGNVDYVTNALEPTYPIGLDCEALTYAALQKAHNEARDPQEREHVTPYVHCHPNIFRCQGLRNPLPCPVYRWTVDTPEDFGVIERILTALYPANPQFRWTDILPLMQAHPDWVALNAGIEHRAWNKRYDRKADAPRNADTKG